MMKNAIRILAVILMCLGGANLAKAQTNVAYSGSGDPVDCPVASGGGIAAISAAR